MQSLIRQRKLESYLEHHRKFHFGIYAMSGIPLMVETIENMWLRCGPVLSFVIPEYVVLLKGWDHHTAALKAIVAGDAERAETRSSPTSPKPRITSAASPTRPGSCAGRRSRRVGKRRRNPPPVERIAGNGWVTLR